MGDRRDGRTHLACVSGHVLSNKKLKYFTLQVINIVKYYAIIFTSITRKLDFNTILANNAE